MNICISVECNTNIMGLYHSIMVPYNFSKIWACKCNTSLFNLLKYLVLYSIAYGVCF